MHLTDQRCLHCGCEIYESNQDDVALDQFGGTHCTWNPNFITPVHEWEHA